MDREALDRAHRRLEIAAGAHALVRGGIGAVHGDLDALRAQAGQLCRARRVDEAAVGLELERDAARGEDLEEIPRVRDA